MPTGLSISFANAVCFFGCSNDYVTFSVFFLYYAVFNAPVRPVLSDLVMQCVCPRYRNKNIILHLVSEKTVKIVFVITLSNFY